MKWGYYLCLVILLLIFLGFIMVLNKHLEFSTWITTSATFLASFAALVTAVIALGLANKPSRFVRFEVETEVDTQHIASYNPADLPKELNRGLDNNSFSSYRVYFKIKNKSKFTLKNPVITFRLPFKLTHPHKTHDNNWIPYFRSNLYNVQIDLRSFEYEGIVVLSNKILPYLNSKQELPVWIRMCLLKDDINRKQIYIDLNCDNAEGSTLQVPVPQLPSQAIRQVAMNEDVEYGRKFST